VIIRSEEKSSGKESDGFWEFRIYSFFFLIGLISSLSLNFLIVGLVGWRLKLMMSHGFSVFVSE
jgi:hypothetical protein